MEEYKSPRIIALEIDEFDLDSGVDEIALVESPAIEEDFYYFSNQTFESYTDYPKAASDAACKVLRWIDEHGRDEVAGMTRVGLARANQLCKREPISEDTIARMAAFARHKQNAEISEEYKGTPWKDKGYVAWLGWGSDEGIEWAQRKLKQIRGEDFVENAGGFSIGDYVSWTYAGRSEGDDRGRGQIKDLRVQGKLKVPGTDFELSPTEDRPAALIETRDGSLVGQYTDNLRKIQKPDDFNEMELDVLGYQTEYFYMCPGAVGTFTHLMEMNPDEDTAGMIRSAAQIADNIFQLESEVLEDETANLEQLGEAQVLLDDFYDLMDEIDELLGMEHDVSYMEGHIRVIRDYIDEKVLEYILRDIMEENKYISDLPSDVQNKLLERLEEVGESEESMEKEGWELIDDEQKFAISSTPDLDSLDDYGKFRVRYKYTGPRDSKNRDFCRRLLDKNLLFRKEDINQLTITGENSEFGIYDIFKYKGSYGCRHFWTRKVYSKNDNNREIVQNEIAQDEATSVNPKPTMNRNPNGEDVAQTDNSIQSNFSEHNKEKHLIAGPLMIPRKLIYRYDEKNGEYYVYFTEDTIEKISYKYLMNKYQDKTNLEHSEDVKLEDVVLVESWLVQEPEKDKSYTMTGKQYPKGTWFGIMKVKNGSVWKEWVKTGRVKGFSVEGFFSDRIINASKHQFYYRTTEGGTEIVIDHKTLVVFILKDGEREAILPDGTYELSNGKKLRVIDSKAVKGTF